LGKSHTTFSLEELSYGNLEGVRQLHDSQFGKLRCSKFDLVIVAISDVDENAGPLRTMLRNPNRETIMLRFLQFLM
jgi:hypothetical protein